MSVILKDLIYNRADITLENLKLLKGIELKVVCALLGIAAYGSKAVKINRILDLLDLRSTLAEYDSSLYNGVKELADFYYRVELHDMCRRAKIWKSGNKVSLAASLLQWRNRGRRQGQKFYDTCKGLRSEHIEF